MSKALSVIVNILALVLYCLFFFCVGFCYGYFMTALLIALGVPVLLAQCLVMLSTIALLVWYESTRTYVPTFVFVPATR